MGQCEYCGNNAGFLRKKHRGCDRRFKDGVEKVMSMVIDTILHGGDRDITNLMAEANLVAHNSYMTIDDIQSTMAIGWSVAIDECLKDIVISHDDERQIDAFREHYICTDHPDAYDSWERFALGVVIRDVIEGCPPSHRQEITGQIPVNFQNSETLIWIFNDVELSKERTVRMKSFQHGRPHRPLFPVDKSKFSDRLYYSASESTHRTLSQQTFTFNSMEYLATGPLIATTENIYFVGDRYTQRLSYGQIMSISADYEAIQVVSQDETCQMFSGLEGHLASSLILGLARRAQ